MEKINRKYQYLTAITGLLAMVSSGLHFAWTSPSLPQYQSGNSTSFTLTNDEGSWIMIMQLVSPPVSCFLGAFMMDSFGRKKSILLCVIPYFFAWMLICFAQSAIYLYIARLLAGISDGMAFTLIPLHLGEIADPEIRGLLGSAVSACFMLGMLFINVMGSFLSISTTAAICSVLPIIQILTFVWMPESPYHLLMKNNVAEARSSLRKLKGVNDVEQELERLQEAVRIQNANRGSYAHQWVELFKSKSNRRSMFVMVVLRNSQQMSGTAAISFYTLTIFSEAGDFVSPLTATILYGSIQSFMTGLCSVVIDKTGRRPLLIASIFGSGVCLLLEGIYFYLRDYTAIDTSTFFYLPVVALVGFVFIFHVGGQPIPLLMQSELFPTNVKGLASCLFEIYFCFLASVFSKFFQIMRDNFGIAVPFLFYAFCCVVNLIFVVLFVPETKGKTLEEIQEIICANKKQEADTKDNHS